MATSLRTYPNSDINLEPDHDSEEGGDESDPINGLTFSEMKTVPRTRDNKISDWERVETAMLMFWMVRGVR